MYNYDYIKINEIFVYFLYQESFSKLCIDNLHDSIRFRCYSSLDLFRFSLELVRHSEFLIFRRNTLKFIRRCYTLKSKEINLLLAYIQTEGDNLRSEVMKLQQNLRYCVIDEIDCFELAMCIERYHTFKIHSRNILSLLGLYDKIIELNLND